MTQDIEVRPVASNETVLEIGRLINCLSPAGMLRFVADLMEDKDIRKKQPHIDYFVGVVVDVSMRRFKDEA